MTLRAALYARQSIDSELGMARQQTLCRELIEQRGWTLVDEYLDNDVSATKGRGAGTAWSRMLKAKEEGLIDVVVAVNMDRLLRTLADLVTLTSSGIKVLTVSGEIDLTTADGALQAGVMASVAEFEGKRKAERLVRANAQRLSKGIPAARSRMFGWTDGTSSEALESEAKWVRWAHEQFLAGETLGTITRRFNAEGVPTIRTGKTWSAPTIRHLLERKRNAGILTYKGEPVDGDSKITPLVSLEDHEAVVALLEARPTPLGRPALSGWLSGIVRCQCGKPMLSKSQNGIKGYLCDFRIRRGLGGDHAAIQQDYVHGKVLAYLYGDYSAGWLQAGQKADPERLAALDASLADLTRRRINVQNDMELDGYDRAAGQKRIAELAAQIRELEHERAQLIAAKAETRWLDIIREAGEDSGESAEAWLAWWNKLDLELRRNLVRGYLHIEVKKGGRGPERVSIRPL